MPAPDTSKSDPLIVLLDEIELLSAHTRLMELYLKRANMVALGEPEKIPEELRAKITSLKARLEDGENRFSQQLASFGEKLEERSSNIELLSRVSEQQHLRETKNADAEQHSSEVAALQQRLSFLETAKEQWESRPARRLEQVTEELNSQVAWLQEELARKDALLEQRDAAARQAELNAQNKIRTLTQELAESRRRTEEQQAEILRGERDRDELRQQVALLDSSVAKAQSHVHKELEVVRQDAQAKVTALQSEIAHKTNLLTRHQSAIADLERQIAITAENARSGAASQQALIDSHATEIARRDAELATLTQRIAELQAKLQEQQRENTDALAQAQAAFAAETVLLRNELAEKQQSFERGQGDFQQLEQELRNRNRELQGQLAAKAAVVESLEHNVRQTQIELLAARDAVAHIQQTLAERQQQITDKEHLLETYRSELEQSSSEVAASRDRLGRISEECSALQARVGDLAAQVDGLTTQLNDKDAVISQQNEALRRTEGRTSELNAELGSVRMALEHQQLETQRKERDFAEQLDALQKDLQRREEVIREQEAAVRQTQPAIDAQIHELECRLSDKDRMLEARSQQISMLQAQLESLSGQTSRLEATHRQALEDSLRENESASQALQDQITALRGELEKQSALLEERQAALAAAEQKLAGALDDLRQQSAHWQALLEEQTAKARQTESEAVTLRARIGELERTAISVANNDRIAALEQQLQLRDQKLVELETALQQSRQDSQSLASVPALKLAENPSEQLKAAQDQINELLERLTQLETARQTLQENAGHELQQLRESFEARVGKLRAELAERDRAAMKDGLPDAPQAATAATEEAYKKQIQDLRTELEEKRCLLENRNEELIRVKAEMETMRGHATRPTNDNKEQAAGSFAVELREEDAIEMPLEFVNGSAQSRPDPLQLYDSEPAGITLNHDAANVEKSNRFTELESRVRSWNPEPEKDSTLGSNRRWSAGLFKRRWRA
jgi:chromosome segregation ATPase